MTKDEIMRLAAQVWSANGVYIGPSIAQLTEFAELVAIKERNRIADEAQYVIKRAEARGAAVEREAWIAGLRPAITQSMGAEQVREAIQKVIRARSQQ